LHDDKVNVLTVVANESYEDYVKSLQAEIYCHALALLLRALPNVISIALLPPRDLGQPHRVDRLAQGRLGVVLKGENGQASINRTILREK
jgi:hypothetical protein